MLLHRGPEPALVGTRPLLDQLAAAVEVKRWHGPHAAACGDALRHVNVNFRKANVGEHAGQLLKERGEAFAPVCRVPRVVSLLLRAGNRRVGQTYGPHHDAVKSTTSSLSSASASFSAVDQSWSSFTTLTRPLGGGGGPASLSRMTLITCNAAQTRKSVHNMDIVSSTGELLDAMWIFRRKHHASITIR